MTYAGWRFRESEPYTQFDSWSDVFFETDRLLKTSEVPVVHKLATKWLTKLVVADFEPPTGVTQFSDSYLNQETRDTDYEYILGFTWVIGRQTLDLRFSSTIDHPRVLRVAAVTYFDPRNVYIHPKTRYPLRVVQNRSRRTFPARVLDVQIESPHQFRDASEFVKIFKTVLDQEGY